MNAVEEKAQGFTYAQSEIDDILAECRNSTKLFAEIFFPDRFDCAFSASHLEFFDLIDNSDAQFISVIAHRGWGKSTIANLVLPAKKILFRDSNFIIPLAFTSAQAERDSEDLKTELTTNENIAAVFGTIRPEKRESLFSKEAWKAPIGRDKDGRIKHLGTLVMPRGCGQQIRGLKHGRFRPDFFIADDIEDTEEVRNDEQRKLLKSWVYADVMGAIQRKQRASEGEFPYRFVFIGTLLHQDSLLANLSSLKKFVTIKAPLAKMDKKGESFVSNWTDFMSNDKVLQLYSDYKDAKELPVFSREFMCEPAADEGGYDPDWFKYYYPPDLNGNKNLESVVIVDPKKSNEPTSSETAIVGWSLDFVAGCLYLRDVVNSDITGDEMYEEAAQMALRIGAKVIGVETNGLEAYVLQPFRDYLSRHGYTFELIELRSPNKKGAKDERIKSMRPYYKQGMVFHNPSCCKVLELQLIAGAVAKKKDVADAACYVVELLDLGNRTFMAPQQQAVDGVPYDQYAELDGSYDAPLEIQEPRGLNLWDKVGKQKVSPRLHSPYGKGGVVEIYKKYFGDEAA